DMEDKYHAYQFIRQPQVFPDVRLQDHNGNVIMGIELKGWFALAKEGEPSFRYSVSPNVCSAADLMVVFPWILSEVISGVPRLLMPFVEEAKYAAEWRNYYWQIMRGRSGDEAEIIFAEANAPYPRKNDRFNDSPKKDAGKNFGRVSRSRIMDDFIEEMMKRPISGIPLLAWHKFIKIFSDQQTEENIERILNAIEKEFESQIIEKEKAKEAFEKLRESAINLLHSLS
ncbi:MAG: hypothetical protein WCB64_11910, partial [Desulfobaccales bacterium]